MPSPSEILTPRAQERLRSLRLIARTVVESYVSGHHRSAFKGFSVEFAQHREYARGDELRHIDWKVYGKSDRLFVKQFNEETNLRMTLCLDASGSMAYGSGPESKFDFARKLAAALSYLAISQGDAVGLAVFESSFRFRVPPRASVAHLSNLIRILATSEPDGGTCLAPLLHDLNSRLRRRGLVIVISDFFAPVDELSEALAHFHHKRHEVILFQVLDPFELTFPFNQISLFKSLERDGHQVRLDAPRARKAYLEKVQAFMRQLREACHRYRYDLVTMTTDKLFEEALSWYLTHRKGR